MENCCIITGADRGIGRACALSLAKEGYNLLCTYREREKEALSLKSEINSLGLGKCEIFKCDISVKDDISRLVSKAEYEFGGVSGLVNNAGISLIKLFTETTQEDNQRILDVDYTGMFELTRRVAKIMINQGFGSIVNISSMWGLHGGSCESAYSGAKAAVIGLTKALSKELGPSGIRVNCVCPGVIRTDMNASLGEDALEELKEKTPLRRLGLAEDVGNLVSFLISDKSSFVTGQIISVDGGIGSV